MLAKCANSTCSTPFRRLSEGKLFLVDSRASRAEQPPGDRKKTPHHIEYFWLCNDCAQFVTLMYDSRTGINTVPLVQAEGKAQSSTAVMPSEMSKRDGWPRGKTAGYGRE